MAAQGGLTILPNYPRHADRIVNSMTSLIFRSPLPPARRPRQEFFGAPHFSPQLVNTYHNVIAEMAIHNNPTYCGYSNDAVTTILIDPALRHLPTALDRGLV